MPSYSSHELSLAKHINIFHSYASPCSSHSSYPPLGLDHIYFHQLILNVDGASEGNPSSFAIRGILRIYQGEYITTFFGFLGAHGTNDYAKATIVPRD